MHAQDALKLARRFIELPPEKRRLFLAGLQQQAVDFALLPIPAEVPVAERDGLSYAQQRMWFLWQLDPQGAAYNLPMAVRLSGTLDEQALQSAFDALVARHETLRSRFREADGEVRQQVVAPFAVAIARHDLSALAADEREAQVRCLADAEALAPFDLAHGPLLRVQVLALAEQEHVLLLTLHHIAADGWSYNVLIEEFIRLYDAACVGGAAELPALPIQYRDYALWQRSWLEAGEQERQLDYWRAKLGDDHTPLELPTDQPRPLSRSYRGNRYAFEVEPALAERLRELAREQGVTLFMVLLAAFKVLLQRYSGRQAIRVGVPVANRNRAEVEGLIGCFINTQVLHTEVDPLLDVRQLLQRVKDTALGAQAHQELPFERLVEAMGLQGSARHNPLFQVLYNHQPKVADAGQIRTASGLGVEKLALGSHSARFELALDTYESAGRLHAVFTGAVELFEPASLGELGRHWLRLLAGLAAAPDSRVGELPLDLPAPAPAQPITPPQACVHRLIERAAQAHPQRLAAVCADGRLSYQGLEQRANALANVLLQRGVQPDERVAVMADRSVDMLVAIVAALKSGAAYLPIEPGLAPARQAFMLADSQVRWVLGQADELPDGIETIDIAAAYPEAEAPAQNVSADQLAYVIYTSGTTGMPKGVGVTHGALAHYLRGVAERLDLEGLASLAMVTTPAADLGHTLLFGALCHGKTLHLLDKDRVLDAEGFAAYLQQHAIDAVKMVPSHLQAMLAAGAAALPGRCLVLGGEACPAALLKRIAELAPALRMINHYGPTETTVGVLTHELHGQPLLGSPLPGVSVHVLDACLQSVPGPARGELYIGGATLARGYLGRAALTAERFVPDPCGAAGARLYRSGDWVRRNSEGLLAFGGRMDGQVKIRGHRIELAEIEQHILQVPGIAQAVVRVLGEEGDRYLAAWLVPSAALADDTARQGLVLCVREALRHALAEHQLPLHWQVLERLPVTANGKLDVRALPAPMQVQASHRAAQTPLQISVAAIWAAVLRVERVGLDDNFFALGGHSLLATQVVSRLRRQLHLEVPLRALFDSADLEGFCQALAAVEAVQDDSIRPVDRSQPLPVSHAQHRQWLFWKLNPASTAYNTPLAVRLHGELDRQALQATFDALLARHETLRSVFVERDGQPWQRILPASGIEIDFVDLQGADDSALDAWIQEQVGQPFDLEHGPLLRITLFKTAAQAHVLCLVLHHIVSDGWSMSVMVRELAARYNSHAARRTEAVPALAVQYADYAAWQRQRLAGGLAEQQLAYWRRALEDDFSVLALPSDHPRPPVQSYRGARIDLHLPAALTARLRQRAVQANATLFHVFLAGFALVLARHSGQDKVNVGIPVTNRNREELEGLIGFFVNTLVARITIDPAQRGDALLAAVRETTLQAQANKDVPFDAVVDALKPERALGHNPLFQVMYNHLRDVGEQIGTDAVQGVRAEEIELGERTAQFDLALDTLERSNGVTASFTYATDLFLAPRIQALAEHWLQALHGLAEDVEQAVGELPILPASDAQRMSQDWNPAWQRADVPPAVHLQFARQARERPDTIALVLGEQRLSYGELERRANRLAHALRERGVGPEVRVGIALERDLPLIVALLAVLKAGGAYVPLDPDYPRERLAYMLDDSGIRVLLTQAGLRERLPLAPDCAVLEVGDPQWSGYPDSDLATPLLPTSLAYVIYTSGSTGRPKGVAIAHAELAAFSQVAADYSRLSPQDRVLQFATVSFDGFVEQLYPALCHGAQVVMRGQEVWDIATLRERIEAHGVTVADLPTAYWRLLAAERWPAGACPSLRQVHVGGEALPPEGLSDWLASGLGHVRLLNTYGPTEATVVTTVFDCAEVDAGSLAQGNMPIGKPLGGRRVQVCDQGLQPAPVGVESELLIGGQGCLARGYFNRPALTAERFIPDPFDSSTTGGGRLYRSGDLARFDAQGVLEYRGRIDHQVKIRGFRIELGEVESLLQQQPGVRHAVVLALETGGSKQLVGYVVPEATGLLADPQAQAAWRDSLRAGLKAVLPDYMVPAHILLLDSLPLTLNGKLDRQRLPAPDASVAQVAYQPPGNDRERCLAQIWADVLKLERVGVADNFFELGGDSITSIQVVSRARQAGLRFTAKHLFQHQTIASLACVAVQDDAASPAAQAPVGQALLLPVQQAFFEQDMPQRQRWNQSLLLRPATALDARCLEAALQALVARHDSLRMAFECHDGQWQAHYRDSAAQPLTWHMQVADDEILEVLCDEAQGSLDLRDGPLLRALLADLADGSQRLLLVVHHLVVDGVSWRILLEDLQQAYRQIEAGQAATLPARTSSVQAWGQRLHEHSAWLAELPYWQAVLRDQDTALPCANPHGALREDLAVTLESRLDALNTRRLLQEAPAAYRTQVNDLLLTALARVVTRWTGSASLLVELEGHGREELFEDIDLSRTVGWFTSLYPVQLTPSAGLEDSIKAVKEQLRAVPGKGLGFGVLRYMGTAETRQALAALPVPRITFNYLGRFDSSFDAADALFAPASEARGREHDGHAPLGNWLTVNGHVYGGALSLSWTFSREMFDSATIQHLADAYAEELEALVRHCCDAQPRGVTPSDFPLVNLDQRELDALPVPAAHLQDIYPLSPMQQGMLFHTLLEQGGGDYVNQMRVDVQGLDSQRFKAAWEATLAAHDVLRSAFILAGPMGEPLQLIHQHVALPYSEQDWQGRSEQQAALAALADAERVRGFDLAQAPLLRLLVVRTGEQSHHLVYTSHHILMDGWSNARLLAEVLQRYAGQTPPAAGGRYRDYIAWLQAQDAAASQRFWRARLADLAEPTRLAQPSLAQGDESAAVRPNGRGSHECVLDAARTRRLGEFARQHKVTVNTLVQAAWLLLLQRFTGQASVAFGATVAGRPADLPGIEEQIGLFINTLPVIATPRPEQSVEQWLQDVQGLNLALREHEHTPLYEIQRWAGQGGEALFDSILVFENYPVSEALQRAPGDLSFSGVSSHEQTNYPMTLAVSLGDELSLHFIYQCQAFSAQGVRLLACALSNLLDAMLAGPRQSIGSLALLDAEQQQAVLAISEQTEARWPSQRFVHQLFADQAQRTPQAVAVISGE
uniref:non-ribosomal peptide synthetase n=1 Tax=uncultured Pseudomonas sp. TaxID=114707 RepID=UPI0025EDDE3D